MPDDTDLTPQDATPAAEGSEDVTSEAPAPEMAAAAEPSTAIETDQTSASATGRSTTDGGHEALIQLALTDLQNRRNALQQEIEVLSQRKQALEQEMTASFAGQSDAIARKVKGFQDYLGGALQGLVQSVETMELVVQPMVVQPSPLDSEAAANADDTVAPTDGTAPAVADTFRPDEALIRANITRFLEQPDFYAEPWKLRRSLDSSDTAMLEDWFFNQGGRGAQASRGNRPRNVLVGAALIAVIGELYGDQFQTLVLAGRPERLGEWRRGLQDALGLGREDFGPSSGIVLFERGDALVERADRLEERGEVPLILIDAGERFVDIPVLQFPLWLAFAAGPGETDDDDDDLL
ncbi:DUF3086 domain-containing protein [Synechococcus sp. A15-60]|uniref:DUF3086 domain-containing protein n=1 Tax=Synechococcus sp. A15-60 TaxID=1050655 RepID=UPI0016461845|nr:DUF3086 domain-containing protein [Synechococcus sp. A15-60]QNI47556.1 hypothetical protein SynA1560_00887 [Synechococcus sp. A15-60]